MWKSIQKCKNFWEVEVGIIYLFALFIILPFLQTQICVWIAFTYYMFETNWLSNKQGKAKAIHHAGSFLSWGLFWIIWEHPVMLYCCSAEFWTFVSYLFNADALLWFEIVTCFFLLIYSFMLFLVFRRGKLICLYLFVYLYVWVGVFVPGLLKNWLRWNRWGKSRTFLRLMTSVSIWRAYGNTHFQWFGNFKETHQIKEFWHLFALYYFCLQLCHENP